MGEKVDKKQLSASLFKRIKEILDGSEEMNEKLFSICKLLKETVPYYDWVGFYLLDRFRADELVLGPFLGEPTEHKRIPFGRGICGQAAAKKETILVQDVSQETNYLACSPDVKAEIVVPIFKNETLVGVLDIDSHAFAPFSAEDREFLQKVCELVSVLL